MSARGLGSRAIIGEYYARLEQNDGTEYIAGISNYFTSDQESEIYKWLGMSPAMREWVGGRHAHGFRENGFTIKNKKFEATMEVLVDEIRRDKTGQVMIRVREMADRTNAHWAKLLCALLLAGESAICYDGQYFFDTDHSEGESGTQSNIVTLDIATPADPTASEMEKAVLKAVERLVGFLDDKGEPMNENANAFHVMVPTSFMAATAAALKNPIIVDGTGARTNTITNIGGFQFGMSVSPRLSPWATKFAVLRTDAESKALIRQEEEGVKMSAVAEGSELEFNEDKHRYGVKTIRNAGYGLWQRGALVSFT